MLKKNAVLAIMLVSLVAQAQEPIALYDPTALYREALDLFDHQKFVPAKEKFEEYIQLEKNPQHALRVNSEYYNGICALYLFHKDAEFQLEKFVREHPDSPWKQHVYFELATFNYKVPNYKKALEWFEFVDEQLLSQSDKIEFRYKRGHSRYEQGDVPGARQDFFEVTQAESDYKMAAIYYYSHIAYVQNDLQTALEGFQKLNSDPAFKSLVPYYITQIYYKQKKYDEVLVYGPQALEQAQANATKWVPEISRLIGDSYCFKEKYKEALPYLERYHADTPKSGITREDYYQLGYAYHRTASYQKAIEAYGNCTAENDELHQRASYNLGECYLKMQQKEYARNAFEEAAEMTFNKEIEEDAMFNYAKLAFELSYNPFHEAITAFEEYLNKYPKSLRRDEAYEFLLNVYMNTRNYEKALASLDKIQNKDSRIKEAYQVVAYNRGVELFQSEDYTNAEKFFDKVPTYPVNPEFNADAKFWKAEIAYRQGSYPKARERYNAFLNEPGAFSSQNYGLAHYGLGYTWFKMANEEDNYDVSVGQYNNANTSFRKYVDGNQSKDAKKVNDANLRIGDCFFVQKSYAQAIQYYDKCADDNGSGKDYAMFQKALCYGYDGKNDKKAWVLKSLLTDIPDSRFKVDAKYELAKTYLSDGRIGEAKTYYNDIVTNHNTSQYTKLSMRDLCLVYVQEGNEAKAKEMWNTLKAKYPGDAVLKDAYAICKEILIDDPDFRNDAVSIGGASKDEVETEVYRKASGFAQDGDCATAITKLSAYLQSYQPAYYAIDAHYFLANCYLDKGDKNKAFESLTFIINSNNEDYLEECLVSASAIAYENASYQQALQYYRELEQIALLKNHILESQIGQMRCNYLLGEKADAKIYADKVLLNPSTQDDVRYTALLWRGRILLENGELDAANADFKEVVKRGGAAGAEAKYSMALILYKKAEYKKCETEIFQMVEKFSAFPEWKFKAFLLLADDYVAIHDYFQARATLNAIKENTTEQWVLTEVDKRLVQLDALENPQGTGGTSNDVEIDLVPNNN
jgi:TolA-binding protein